MITFDHVSKTYPGQTRAALSDIDVEIGKGEFVFLVGASGSGKSTFLRLILREYRPSKGHVFVAGNDLGRLPGWKIPALRRQVGTVFQDFRLLPGKTVYENVAFALQVIGKKGSLIRRTVPETLDLVGLGDKGDRLPDELSGGEQQRVAIARALINEPKILLADEPTGNLDNHNAWEIMKLLEEINSRGTTVVVVTHNLEIVKAMNKRVITMKKGVVVEDSEGDYSDED